MILMAGGPVGGSAAQQAARAELRHAEYHRDDPGPVDRALHWLDRHLDHVASGGSHALLIVLVVLLAVLVLVAVRAGVPRRTAHLEAGVGGDPLATVAARDHRRLALQYGAEGRRAEALREWLRAAIATIEERGVLPPRPGRTGAATAREAGPLLPAAADDLRAATVAFDEVWYGGRAASDQDVAVARAAADAVQAARITEPAATSGDGIAVPW